MGVEIFQEIHNVRGSNKVRGLSKKAQNRLKMEVLSTFSLKNANFIHHHVKSLTLGVFFEKSLKLTPPTIRDMKVMFTFVNNLGAFLCENHEN